MSDKKRCPKCQTGIANPNICNRCGINVTEYERHEPKQAPPPLAKSGPRPGGNKAG